MSSDASKIKRYQKLATFFDHAAVDFNLFIVIFLMIFIWHLPAEFSFIFIFTFALPLTIILHLLFLFYLYKTCKLTKVKFSRALFNLASPSKKVSNS